MGYWLLERAGLDASFFKRIRLEEESKGGRGLESLISLGAALIRYKINNMGCNHHDNGAEISASPVYDSSTTQNQLQNIVCCDWLARQPDACAPAREWTLMQRCITL